MIPMETIADLSPPPFSDVRAGIGDIIMSFGTMMEDVIGAEGSTIGRVIDNTDAFAQSLPSTLCSIAKLPKFISS